MLRDLLKEQGPVVTVEPDAKVAEVCRLMEQKNVGTVLVLTGGKPRGILTDRDIVIRCLAKNIDVDDCTVENIMTESIETCRDDEGVFDCIEKMRKAGVRRIPVVGRSDGKVIGVVSFGDFVRILAKELNVLVERTTAEPGKFGRKAAA